MVKLVLARTTGHNSRIVVHAASLRSESHGQYLPIAKSPRRAPLVLSDEGKKAQDRVWDGLVKMLEAIRPGVTSNF